ncbi:hypothetical protein EMIT0P253_20255 [Pseudomonas sp. IT-P253]|jgi:ABC-type polar amino acid transport system ATPase subunit
MVIVTHEMEFAIRLDAALETIRCDAGIESAALYGTQYSIAKPVYD